MKLVIGIFPQLFSEMTALFVKSLVTTLSTLFVSLVHFIKVMQRPPPAILFDH